MPLLKHGLDNFHMNARAKMGRLLSAIRILAVEESNHRGHITVRCAKLVGWVGIIMHVASHELCYLLDVANYLTLVPLGA